MRTRRLGSSDLEVTVVGLGCNNFGGRIDEDASRAVIDAALDAGVTFFDTADVYGNKGGSEEIIGRALVGRRDQVVLATKFGHDLGDGETARGARPYIRKAVEASLRRLQTDRIDLYQYHRPDGITPLEETLGALERARPGRDGPSDRLVQLHRADGRGVARRRRRAWLRSVRLRAERVLVARPEGRGGAPAGLRTARRRLHPVLSARERPADRQVPARRARPRGDAAARPRARRRQARPGRAAGGVRGRARASRCSTSRSAGSPPCPALRP